MDKNPFREYLKKGWTCIPLKENLTPAVKSWKIYGKRKPTKEEMEDWNKKYNRYAVLTGLPSGITVLDIDDVKIFKANFGEDLFKKLYTEAFQAVESKSGGLHLYFGYTPELKTSVHQNLGFDIRNDGALIRVPPTLGYRLLKSTDKIVPVPEEFIVKLRQLQTWDKLPQLIGLLEEIYIEGYRQNISLYLAGFLRKRGFSEERVEEILEEIWRFFEPSIDKNEKKQRLTAISNTFKKRSFDEIKGIAGLREVAEEIFGDFEKAVEWTSKLQNLFPIKLPEEDFSSEEVFIARGLANSPELLDLIVSVLDKVYLGRIKEKKLLYLICLFSKLNVSTLVVVSGDTSVGKSSLIETILKVIPEEEKLVFTTTSERFFLYLRKPLHRKIVYIYEITGAKNSLPFLRTFISEGKARLGTILKIKGELRIEEIEKDTRGLVVFTSSTKGVFDEETINRGFLLNLEAEDNYIREVLLFKSQKNCEEPKEDFKILQVLYKLLKPAEVIVPYQEILAKTFPADQPRRMRDFEKVISLIKAHALLYQYQREKTSDKKIVATINDYRGIYELADLIAPSFVKITKKAKQFLDWLSPSKPEKELENYPYASRASVYRWKKDFLSAGLIEREDKILKVVDNPSALSNLPHPDEIEKELRKFEKQKEEKSEKLIDPKPDNLKLEDDEPENETF